MLTTPRTIPRIDWAVLAKDAEFKESDHPRREDGKFGSSNATEGKNGNGKPVANLSGDELGDFGDNLKGLRAAAIQWYRDNLQKGKPAYRNDLGKIRFSKVGRDEIKGYSANADKLKMVPAIRTIIESGARKGPETPDHPRKDGIVAFHPIEAPVSLGGKTFDASVLIGEDKNGKLFYDLFPDEGIRLKRKAAQRVPGSKIQADSAAYGGVETTIPFNIILNASPVKSNRQRLLIKEERYSEKVANLRKAGLQAEDAKKESGNPPIPMRFFIATDKGSLPVSDKKVSRPGLTVKQRQRLLTGIKALIAKYKRRGGAA